LRRLKMTRSIPVVLATRGEFSEGALHLHPKRKRIYFRLARWLRLYRGVIWQASSKDEEVQIRGILETLGVGDPDVRLANIVVAPDIAAMARQAPMSIEKRRGELKLVFLSRIVPMKNLAWGISIARRLTGRVTISVYGPREDPAYWSRCLAEAERLPRSMTFRYFGEVPHDQVAKVISQHHAFFLPTLGENFGHAIQEALSAGRPVVISNLTPWKELSRWDAGYELPLDADSWMEALTELIECDQSQYEVLSAGARRYASDESRGVRQAAAEHLELFAAATENVDRR
jgi:glycosyltransferase involved in cell wall biosynthesis